jgi:hypothetical protein
LFDPKYKPTVKDFTKKEWSEFQSEQKKTIEKGVKNGFFKNESEGLKECPISDFVPFEKRGTKVIKTLADAKKAAINMSKYLS